MSKAADFRNSNVAFPSIIARRMWGGWARDSGSSTAVFKKGKHTTFGSNWTSLPSPSASVVSEDGNENQALDEDDINGNREQKRCAAESR